MSRDPIDTDPTAATVPTGATPVPAPADGDRYELREQLGEGAMGVVWAAHDRALDRMVALKVLSDRFLGGAHQARLAAEARAMARLSHRNVVAVYDVGERDGRTFLTMELVRGVDLGRWLETPRDVEAVLEVFRAVAAGLAAAHAAGIVHRDVKPGNILIGEDGDVRVADFGVAHSGSRPVVVDGAATPSSRTTGLIGSPAYMSPEQLRGEPATALGDQFGFFVSLYEALHGRRPFDGDTISDLRAAIERGAPPPVREVPRWLDAVVALGLSADPAHRFASMAEVVAALAGPRPRRRWLPAALAAALLAGGGVAAIALAGGGDAASACDAVERELAGVWDDAARARVTAGFQRLDRPWVAAAAAAGVAAVDQYAADWIQARRRICEGARARGADAMARPVRCLDDRRRALHQLAGSLASGDLAVAENVADVVAGLPRVADCENPAYLDGVATTDATLAAREDLALARVLRVAGREAEAEPIVVRVIEAARAAGDRGLEAEALHLRGVIENKLGKSGPALESYNAALEAAAAVGAIPVKVDAWIGISHVQQRLGRLDDAGSTLALAEAALREAPDPDRESRLLEAQGTLLGRQGKYAEALPKFERGQAILTELYGAGSPSHVPGHNNLAMVYRSLDRYEDALAELRKSLDIARVYGDAHPEVGRSRHNLAVLLGRLGRKDEAFAEFDAAEQILLGALGEKHLDTAALHGARAAFLQGLNLTDAAINYYRRALAVQLELEPDGTSILSTRSNLSGALAEVDQLEEAEALMRGVMATRIERLGENHPQLVFSHAQLGKLLVKRGRLDDALAAMQASKRVAIAAHGPEHSMVARALRNEASVERQRKHYRRALELDEEALRIRRATLPAGHTDLQDSLQWTIEDLRLVGKPKRAVPLAEEYLESLRASGNPTDIALAEIVLGRVLWESGRDRDRGAELVRAAHAVLLPQAPLSTDLAKWVEEVEALLERMDGR